MEDKARDNLLILASRKNLFGKKIDFCVKRILSCHLQIQLYYGSLHEIVKMINILNNFISIYWHFNYCYHLYTFFSGLSMKKRVLTKLFFYFSLFCHIWLFFISLQNRKLNTMLMVSLLFYFTFMYQVPHLSYFICSILFSNFVEQSKMS